MTRLRMRVADRLKGAQNTYAMLSTFNEIDMTGLMQLRSDYKVWGQPANRMLAHLSRLVWLEMCIEIAHGAHPSCFLPKTMQRHCGLASAVTTQQSKSQVLMP